jgi:hypothetical protein
MGPDSPVTAVTAVTFTRNEGVPGSSPGVGSGEKSPWAESGDGWRQLHRRRIRCAGSAIDRAGGGLTGGFARGGAADRGLLASASLLLMVRPAYELSVRRSLRKPDSKREQLVDVLARDADARDGFDQQLWEIYLEDARWTRRDQVVIDPGERPRIGTEHLQDREMRPRPTPADPLAPRASPHRSPWSH